MRAAVRPRYFWALFLGLLILILYSPSLGYPFQFDDQLFLRDDNVRMARWSAFLWPPAPRLVNWLTLTAQFALWGANPLPLRLFNILLHVLNSALALLLAFRLQRRFQPAARTAEWRAPVLTGLIFALHPLQTESVVYIYQRSTLLAAFFSLLALWLWMSRPRTGSSFWISAASLICCLLAVACKEVALVLPLVLWAFEIYDRRRIRPTLLLASSLAVAALMGGIFLWHTGPGEGATRVGSGESLTYARTQVVVVVRYLRLFLAPVGQSVDPQVQAVPGWISPGWWIRAMLLACLAGAVFWTFRRRPLLSFWLLLGFLFLLPTSSLIPSPDFMFEHRVYLPLLGLAGACSVLLSGAVFGARRFGVLVGCLSLALGVLSWYRIQLWRTPVTLWADAVRKSPGKYRPVFNHGVALMDASPALAEGSFRRAIRLRPELPLAYRSLAQIQWRQGKREDARRLWEAALAREPDHLETLLALGRLQLVEKNFFEAERYLERAATLRPTDWEPRYLLGELYYEFGMTLKALEQAETGLRYHPGKSVVRVLLADCVRRRANWNRAIELYREALQGDPANSRAHLGLAEAYTRVGQQELAVEAARQAVLSASDPSERSRAIGVLRVLNSQ